MPSAPSWRICSNSSSRSLKSSSSPSSPIAYSLPRSEKYTSNTVSYARQCVLFFTSVAASAYLNASRSEIGMWRTASIASRFSVRLTGSPASRNSWMKPASNDRIGAPVAATTSRSTSSTAPLSSTSGRFALLEQSALGLELLQRLGDVALVLEQDLHRGGGLLRVDVLDAEQHQRAGPVERLGDGRRLLQFELTNRPHDAGDLVGELLADVGHLREHDLLLALEIGVVDVEVEAAALERLRQFTRVVGREEHERDLCRLHRAELGHGHLVVRQHLEQQRLGLDLDAVDLVDQQHDGVFAPNRFEQRTGQQELLTEDVLFDVEPLRALALGDALRLDAQELLLVVPLVQRLGLVESLVALETDEPSTGHLGDGLGELRLARPGRALDQHRLLQPIGEVHDAGDAFVREVVDLLQTVTDLWHRLEAVIHCARVVAALTARSRQFGLTGGRLVGLWHNEVGGWAIGARVRHPRRGVRGGQRAPRRHLGADERFDDPALARLGRLRAGGEGR